ncbi:ascomycete fungal laccase from thielavia arenaria [Lasiosphaeris hirsuta]|uniref:laccase n=1 Tax=Lasiosphaeris hirsuta TaxID=260670 RepID=A0AA40A1J3_9PEZI|nr:ascomycete fungal laccase from thielavia arenaria [Lasiosphaeris hirsuta]
MRFFTLAAGLAQATLLSLVAASPSPKAIHQISPRAESCNSAGNRACWTKGFDINTDWEASTPSTGVTRTYTLTITEVDNYVGGDGQIKEKAMLVNSPVITADWGDRVNVTVINNLRANGTSIHFHGIRQLNNNVNDGVSGVTECPIPPGGRKTYTFLATQYGSSWYHSHYSSQYANGVTGSLVINGPASLPFDIDLGAFPISDWYYGAADNIYARVNDPTNPFIPGSPGSPPPSDNIFFNGTNVNPNGPGGSYAKVVLTPGKRHLLRLINPSVDNTFTVSIVGHSMTVVANDFVPVNAYTTRSLYLGVGERYDVTIDASQPVANYWINVTFSASGVCGTSKNPYPAAILGYAGAGSKNPKDRGIAPPDSLCADQPGLQPIVGRKVPRNQFTAAPSQSLSVKLEVDSSVSKVFWKVNESAIDVSWEQPTLELIAQGNSSFPTPKSIITIPDNSEWSFWLIQNLSPIPHPLHLHGHDFVILGRSSSPANPLSPSAGPVTFNLENDGESLNFDNPPRRDATMLPSFGWLLVAFKNDNPGAWLFHCHVAWHVSQGLSVLFLEKKDKIPKVMDLGELEPNCKAWREYLPSNPFPKPDSGL